jgi:hypothetical protein
MKLRSTSSILIKEDKDTFTFSSDCFDVKNKENLGLNLTVLQDEIKKFQKDKINGLCVNSTGRLDQIILLTINAKCNFDKDYVLACQKEIEQFLLSTDLVIDSN